MVTTISVGGTLISIEIEGELDLSHMVGIKIKCVFSNELLLYDTGLL